MTNCPICDTEYLERQRESCSTCSWDLTPYPSSFNPVPAPIIEKEKLKIQWGRNLWQQSHAQKKRLSLVQTKLEQSERERIESESKLKQTQSQLEKSNQERQQLLTIQRHFEEVQQQKYDLQSRLSQTQSQLEQVRE